MTMTVEQAVAAATLYSDEERYKIVHLPPNAVVAAASVLAEIAEPFSVLIIDKDEITLVITESDLETYARRLAGHRAAEGDYRLITFDVQLGQDLIGFMAVVSKTLADAGVTIMPFAAFDRDHLLVPAAQYDNAISALRALQSTVKSG